MARAKFTYDESGASFFYFLLSFLALIMIPCTYYFWPSSSTDNDDNKDDKQCRCNGCINKRHHLSTHDRWMVTKRRITCLLLVLGWVAFFATAYKCANIQHDYVNWDPFEILGVPDNADPADIKKAYRRLSLIYHPDKETGDPDRFLKISKAYAALTDDEARKNWEMYGNPDGPGATSFGIALPSWIVEPDNSVIVLGTYALLFMVILPITVGMWWYRSVKFGCDKVLLNTSELYYYFIHKTPHMVLKRVLMILAASLEFARSHNPEIVERPTDNQEVPQLMRELDFLGEKNKERPLCFSYSIKARALLYAHLSRIKLPAQTLELDRCLIVKKCPYLLQEFVQCVAQLITLALSGRISRYPDLLTLENAMKLCPMVVQALWEFKSPLLQLPHIADEQIKHLSSRRRNVKGVEDLARLKNVERRALLKNITDQQYEDIMNVMSRMPWLVVNTKFEVLDDEDPCIITAGSIVTVTVNMTRKSMKEILDASDLSNQDLDKIKSSSDQENLPVGPDGLPLRQEGGDSTKAKSSKTENQPHQRVWEKDRNKKKGPRGAIKNKAKKKNKTSKAEGLTTQADLGQQPSALQNMDEDELPELVSDDDTGSDKELLGPTAKAGTDKSNDKNNNNTETSQNSDDEDEWERCQEKVIKKQKVYESRPKKSHPVHCPNFPDDKQEFWWVYLVDRKRHALITAPLLVTSLVQNEEVELKFTAPHRPGLYTYTLVVRSDSYVECLFQKMAKIEVRPAKVYDCLPTQWDIPDEENEDVYEEDSAVEDSDLLSSDEGRTD